MISRRHRNLRCLRAIHSPRTRRDSGALRRIQLAVAEVCVWNTISRLIRSTLTPRSRRQRPQPSVLDAIDGAQRAVTPQSIATRKGAASRRALCRRKGDASAATKLMKLPMANHPASGAPIATWGNSADAADVVSQRPAVRMSPSRAVGHRLRCCTITVSPHHYLLGQCVAPRATLRAPATCP